MRKSVVTLCLVALVIGAGAAGSAYANSTFFLQFTTTYPDSGSLYFSCGICHQAVLPGVNRYGADFANNAHNLQAIESLDSDGDGYSNGAEIDAGTNPGDPNSHPATLPPPIPLPTGQQSVIFAPVTFPIVGPSPTLLKPIGVGAVATGGNTFGILVGLDPFVAPVDVYLALYLPAIDPDNTYLLTQNGLQTFAAGGLVPWIANTAAPLNVTLLDGVQTSGLPPGTCFLALLVTPHGNPNAYYLWVTSFVIP